ncbi:MAG: thiamine diphosphokinase [Anaerolineae bacterium]
MRRALIFANGELSPGPMVDRAVEEAGTDALLVAADGGTRHALALGLMPHVVIGDLDSVGQEVLAQVTAGGAEIQQFPPAKDETDLELALSYAVRQGARWLRVIGALGGRLDQTLANVLLLTLPALQGCDIRLVAGRQAAYVITSGEHVIEGNVGDTVSLIPLGGDAGQVRTEGLVYPLDNERLAFGPARGVSNELALPVAHVTVGQGHILVVHTLGRA